MKTGSKNKGSSSQKDLEIRLYRNEAKYIIPPSLVPDVRAFIQPYCKPDPYCQGNPPEYEILTIQLDTPTYALHRAKEEESLDRFKLRVRTYNKPGSAPVFLEVKKKYRRVVVKTRAMIPFECWGKNVVDSDTFVTELRSDSEREGYLEFVRLARETLAEPVSVIKYTRESYSGLYEKYARVTLDRRLFYQPSRDWTYWGEGGRWLPIDTPIAQRKMNEYSGVVLELKSFSYPPPWMSELVRLFRLNQTGNCKYSTAVWQEALFVGKPVLPQFMADDLVY